MENRAGFIACGPSPLKGGRAEAFLLDRLLALFRFVSAAAMLAAEMTFIVAAEVTVTAGTVVSIRDCW